MGSYKYLLTALTAMMMFIMSCSTAPSIPTTITAENIVVEQIVPADQRTETLQVGQRRVVNNVREAAVRVWKQDRSGYGTGTYFKLDGHLIVITAAHVVDRSPAMIVEGRNNESVLARTLYYDEDNDIAVLELGRELQSRTALRYKERRPDSDEELIADDVFYTGFPARHDLFTAFGKIASAENDHLLMHSYAWMGASGSGVFDTRGRLIGVLVAVDLGWSPYDPHRMFPPNVVEDVVHVIPIRHLDLEALRSILD